MAQNSQTRQLKTLLDTYTYSTSDSVPTKTLKVRKIYSYNDLQNLPHTPFLDFFVHYLLLQLNWPTSKLTNALTYKTIPFSPVHVPRPTESSQDPSHTGTTRLYEYFHIVECHFLVDCIFVM